MAILFRRYISLKMWPLGYRLLLSQLFYSSQIANHLWCQLPRTVPWGFDYDAIKLRANTNYSNIVQKRILVNMEEILELVKTLKSHQEAQEYAQRTAEKWEDETMIDLILGTYEMIQTSETDGDRMQIQAENKQSLLDELFK